MATIDPGFSPGRRGEMPRGLGALASWRFYSSCPSRRAGFAGTNHIFVSNEKGNGVTVLNATDYTPVTVIKTGARPRGMVFSPDHKLLYVACGGANRIDIVDVVAMKVVGRLPGIDDPETFDLDKKGERLFISNEDDGVMSIFDLGTTKRIKSVKVGLEPEGVLLNPHDDTKVYMSRPEGSSTLVQRRRYRHRQAPGYRQHRHRGRAVSR